MNTADDIEAYHKWRWRALTIWIIAFSCVVIYALNLNSNLGSATAKHRKLDCDHLKSLLIDHVETDSDVVKSFPSLTSETKLQLLLNDDLIRKIESFVCE